MPSLEIVKSADLSILQIANCDLLSLLLADKRSPATKRAYAGDVAAFFGHAPTPDEVRAFVSQPAPAMALALGQYKAAMRDKGLAEATINRRLAAMRSLLKFAHRLGQCASDGRGLVDGERNRPYRDTRGVPLKTLKLLLRLPGKLFGIESSRACASKNNWLLCNTSKGDKFINTRTRTIRALRDIAILRLLVELALRRAEVCRLAVGDFEPEGRALWVLGKGHGAQRQRMTVSVAGAAAIAEYLAVAGHSDGPLFRSLDNASRGHGLTGDGIYSLVAFYGQAAGLARLTPHQLRHSSISAALDATKGDVRKVQKLSRHAKVETLLIYDDNRADMQGEVSGILSGLLK